MTISSDNFPLTLQCATVQTVHLHRIGGKRQQLWRQLLNSDNINIIFSDSLNKECPVPVHHQVDEAEGVRGEVEVKRLMKLVVARHISKNPTLPWILL